MKLFLLAIIAMSATAQINVTGNNTTVVEMTSLNKITCSAPATGVTCLAPPPVVNLPIEVYGPNGTTVTTLVNIPNFTGNPVLYLQVHGVRYGSQASVKVNNSNWIQLAAGTILGNGASFGGIGGAFATLSMTIPLNPGVILSNSVNTVIFEFVGTDGISSGYRVLDFNFQLNGVNLIPSSSFQQVNPNNWTPPLNDASDIAMGKTLWSTANLQDPASGAMIPITAHCSDCHAANGEDLKYFNYSNNTIITRAQFHGLSLLQGQQIASYIRSLTTPNPGLPWNPPYQPGAGMDTVPISNWSAGAGLSAVLANDSDLAPYLTNASATAYLNPRTTPVPFQFPDWNNWLPQIWPGDAYGTAFTQGNALKYYLLTRTELVANNASAYKNSTVNAFANWNNATGTFITTETTATNPNYNAVWSIQKWKIVKHWEVNQDFGLEGMPSAIYGAKANPRGWYGGDAFGMEFAELHIPKNAPVMNGLLTTWEATENTWNFLEFVLNDGQGNLQGSSPEDFGYEEGDVKDLSIAAKGSQEAYVELYVLIKSLQEYTLNGVPPNGVYYMAFAPNETNPGPLADPSWNSDYTGYPASVRTNIATEYTQAWFNQLSTYTPAQWYAGKDGNGRPFATITEDCSKDGVTTFGGAMWFHMPRLKTVGVPAALIAQMYTYLAKVFPATNWTTNMAITCNQTLGCTGGI